MYFCICMCAWLSVYVLCVCTSAKGSQSVGFPGTGVRGYCELPDVGALVSLQEQCVLLTTLPSPPHRMPLTNAQNKVAC